MAFVVFWFFKKQESAVLKSLTALGIPIESVSDLDRLVEKAGGAKLVLLGESSHGTSEYYKWRAGISKRLISEKGFSFIAVEGDWPYLYRVNRYVKGLAEAPESGREALSAPERWPDWMWANEEFLELVEWLRLYNENLPLAARVGIYGMDMQDLRASISAAISEVEALDPSLALLVAEKYACFETNGDEISTYARNFASSGSSCEDEAAAVLDMLDSGPEFFEAEQNMLAVRYAEEQARQMAAGGSLSWNTRVRYMKKTINRLSERYGEGSKGIVWAHNTHVGDAHATEMANAGMVNIGQLARDRYGQDDVFILGFSTFKGTVVAGRQWGAERQILAVPEPPEGTLEYKLGSLEGDTLLFLFDGNDYPQELFEPLGHRAKGSVYNPEFDERQYFATVLPRRYDALIFIRETTALNPL